MQRISWTEKKTNESVRMEIGIKEETLQEIALRRKLGFFGHVMRSEGLEKGMMLAHGDGRRRRGEKWMDEMHEVTGMKLVELRDVTTVEKAGEDKESTAQYDKVIKRSNHTLNNVDCTNEISCQHQ